MSLLVDSCLSTYDRVSFFPRLLAGAVACQEEEESLAAATAGLNLTEEAHHLELDQTRVTSLLVDLCLHGFISLASEKTHT